MIMNGARVKVLDNYSGGLDGVKGAVGKIVSTELSEGKTFYKLDIMGQRTNTVQYSTGPYTYTSSYYAIVKADEIEEQPYNYKDMNGQLVELGDIVVYGVHGGGLIKGTVVDFKDVTHVRWGRDYDELKMKIESEHSYDSSDGGDRKVAVKSKHTRWLSGQSRTLIIQKNPARQFFISKDLIVLNGES